ncbi:hypothetical protein ASPWEDRAFT_53378 [Aspergillus wentii DTO 134E9]|uniref:peptidylprolyl isomerase n=1 Tax=Aspergillus wentii DTO 134E9 TaxID=1073089 RepID=A0A1L9REV0_ASPWE|nr:uncharacterized protein ASPWEDRAFT_53378 [Aspergillus wentii DTO 134E9]KAI9933681.1 FK506-binding protein 1A [Aspergillus wentii]OJJ33434.1 hypothetical protein ASPWEDRAFT_53378 [Aspergillus wentii DTO 134E9]
MGVTKQTTAAGDGVNFPKKGDHISMHYRGHLETPNGPEFDSSYKRNAAFETPIGVGRVIKGWEEGVPQMSLGEKAYLTITPDYGYGARGFPPVIPANSTLVFEVHLVGINDQKV